MTLSSMETGRGKYLNDILKFIGCSELNKNPYIEELVLDSRKVGKHCLFIALKGSVSDGRNFIESALASGAEAILVEEGVESESISASEKPLVAVKDLRKLVGRIASYFEDEPSHSLNVVAITGTNGKTTCAQLGHQLFELLGEKSATIGTLGYGSKLSELRSIGLTTPDAVSCHKILREFVTQGVQSVFMEVSSHAIVQSRSAGIAFRGAVFTNLTRDHLDFHGDMASYGAVKSSLFESTEREFAVINLDDELGMRIASSIVPEEVVCIGYSACVGAKKTAVSSLPKVVSATELQFSDSGLECQLSSPWGEGRLQANLLGRFNLYNVLCVVSMACASGYSLSLVLEEIKKLVPVVGRMQLVKPPRKMETLATVCVDYAHTPDALEQALCALREHTERDLWVVFGCGGDRDKGKRPLMGSVAEKFADKIVICSDNPRTESAYSILRQVAEGIKDNKKANIIENRSEAIAYAVKQAGCGDLVLIAGKGHEDYQIVGEERLAFSDVEETLKVFASMDVADAEQSS